MTSTDAATASAPTHATAAGEMQGEPRSPRGSRGPIDARLLRYARAARAFFAASAVIVLAQTAVIVGFAWLLSHTLVGAIQGAPIGNLTGWLVAAAALVLARGILIAVSERVSAAGAARASLQLRDALVRAVERLGPAWLARRNAAGLAITAGHGMESLDAYFGRYLPQLVATAITLPLVLLAILLADPLSALIVAVTLPLIPLFMVLIGLATRAVQRRQYRTLGRLATRFADTVEGLGTLKIFGRQLRAADSIEAITRTYKRETMTVLRVSFLSGFMLEFLASISVAIIAVTIGFRLLAGDMPLELGLLVLLLAPEAYLPLRQVGTQFHAAAEGVAATDEIFAVLDEARAIPDAAVAADAVADAAVADAAAPLLALDAVQVVREGIALPAVTLAVRAGEIVLLEGPSGSGKSSTLAAVLGFAPFHGTVRVRGAVQDDARDIVAWAGQRPGLLAATVGENVALGDDTPDAALLAACLVDAQLPEVSPDLALGAGGSGLSGGQAQRVAVARALYRLRRGRARVLVLDEPSSALDAATEAALWRALRAEARGGAGILLVSHRPTARDIADRVVRVEPEVSA